MTLPQQPRQALFSKRDEQINLGLTYFFLVISFIELALQKNPLDQFLDYQKQIYFFYVFFLSIAHVAVTPVMIHFLPEINLLNRQQKKRSELGIKNKTYIFFGFLFIAVFALEMANSPLLSKILLAVLVVGNIWHFISQYMGISLFYLAKRRRSVNELNSSETPDVLSFDRTRIIFKKLIYTLILTSLCYQVLVQVFDFGHSPYFGLVRWIMLAAELLCIFAIYLLLSKSLKSDLALKYQKYKYSLRLFLFPLSFFSLVAGLSLAAIHAVEYILICRRYTNASEIQKTGKITFKLTALLVIGLNLLAYTIVWRQQDLGEVHYALASAFFAGLTFTHFYSDRLLFRMKDPAVKELNAKLMGQ